METLLELISWFFAGWLTALAISGLVGVGILTACLYKELKKWRGKRNG